MNQFSKTDGHTLPLNLLLYTLGLGAAMVFFSAFGVGKYHNPGESPLQSGIQFKFKNQKFALIYPMQRERQPYRRGHIRQTNARLDTLSNWLSISQNYAEIIRQDDPLEPHFGIALGFEFDPKTETFPVFPALAKLQFKDFSWGGVEFSPRDSSNFTGVSNTISDDLTIQVDGFQNDTIYGRFNGVLLSAAGPMAPIDSGYFRAFVYRVE
ncbi:MAG: hypothetical protein H6574_03415 [Lewinellaceae bacterium]|nr:hypothetical protein [Lewinellaceae bacterium]MCB9330107.1 hypothetical protein [Lewinellaceae bacterium]